MTLQPGKMAAALLAIVLPTLAQATETCPAVTPAAIARPCVASDLARLDREVNQALGAAAALMDASARQHLKRDQSIYEQVRASGLAGADYDLSMQMTLRRDFLRTIREPKGKWLSHWANATGAITITTGEGGALQVRVSAAEPTLGSWMCEFEDTAQRAGTALVLGATSARMELGGPNEGWTLSLRMVGDVVSVEEHPPKGATGNRPFCSGGGKLAGVYFGQATPEPLSQTAARSAP